MKKQEPAGIVRTGRLQFHQLHVTREWRDIYHWLLALNWLSFSGFLLAAYLALNLFFAGLYLAGAPCIAGMPPHSFSDAFFFSVETLSTVGYGHLYPNTLYGHIIATLEIMSGMAGIAVMTGIIFVRFSRPSARLQYSTVLVVTPFDGQPALMWRVANLRQNAMVEAEFQIMLIRNERIREGDTIRRFHPLPIQFDRVSLFPAALTIRHIIDEKSPLHGLTAEELQRSDSRFFASVVCVDTVIPAPVQSQHIYSWRDIRFGRRFVEIYNDLDNDIMEVDYARLSETEPTPPPLSGSS
jgi:inward rectifier potassium channel